LLEWTALVAAALIVGLSKAGFGSGVGVLAVPLVAMALGSRQMLGVLLPVLILGDLLSIPHYLRAFDRRSLRMLLPGCAAGIVCGMLALGWFKGLAFGGDLLDGLVGALCIFFVSVQAYLMVARKRSVEREEAAPYRPRTWHGLLAGTSAGLTSTLAHGAGPVIAMFLLPQRLGNRLFVGTTVWFFAACNLLKLGPYVWRGVVTLETLSYLPYLAPAVLIGTLAGVWLNRRLSGRVFSAIVYAVVFVTGMKLIVGALR
jgi:uncharacterized membrane protein YfcA